MSGHYMERSGLLRCAGCMVMAVKTGRFLMSFRSVTSSSPLTWAPWGGKCEYGEYPDVAAKRELLEESGLEVSLPLQHIHHFGKSGFQFDTYLAIVKQEFDPVLSSETEKSGWFELDAMPEPLHDGMKDLLGSKTAMKLLHRAVEDRFWVSH